MQIAEQEDEDTVSGLGLNPISNKRVLSGVDLKSEQPEHKRKSATHGTCFNRGLILFILIINSSENGVRGFIKEIKEIAQ
jgi:hypothetical protein